MRFFFPRRCAQFVASLSFAPNFIFCLRSGRCCACMFHDLGDVIEYKDGKWLMTPGNSPAYPPCFQGKTIAYMKVIGADRYKGAAPEGTEMER